MALCNGCGKEIKWTECCCPDCRRAYNDILENPPLKLIEMLGEDNIYAFDYDRDYLPLVAIETRASNGEISKSEAQYRKDAEWKRIRRERNPTREEFDEDLRRGAAARTARRQSVYDSIFN